MSDRILPVIAHRMYGFGSDERIAWSADPVAPVAVAGASAAIGLPWRDRSPNPYREGRRLADMIERDPEPPVTEYASPGTRVAVDEIRDLIDGGGRAETTAGDNLTQIWDQAGIGFRLVAVVDHTIMPINAYAISTMDVARYARLFNHIGVLNLYFFRNLFGASGVARFSPFPDNPAKNSGHAAVQDYQEWGLGTAGWPFFVETVAHEVGHFLNLLHREDAGSNLMAVNFGIGSTELRPLQKVVARASASRYLPLVARFRVMSASFRQAFDDPESEPLVARAYLGERWRFGSDGGGSS